MPRKRTLPFSVQTGDRDLARGLRAAVHQLLLRYPEALDLKLAERGLDDFITSDVTLPKKKRQAKPRPLTDGIPPIVGEVPQS